MVTSGAIALGMRLMELPQRPRAIDELQAASAVGQGTLFRAYEARLAERDVHAAQVLLTSFDLSVRMHYLNAAPGAAAAARLARGAGRERERHHRDRRDHLRRQRLPLRPGGAAARRPAAGPAHRHRRACTPPTRAAIRTARLVERVDDFSELDALRDRRAHLAVRLRRHAQQGRGGRDGERGRDPGGDLRRHRARDAARGRARRAGRHPVRAASRAHAVVQALASLREAGARAGGRRRRRRAGAARAGLEPAPGRDHRGRGRVRRRRRGRGRLRRGR